MREQLKEMELELLQYHKSNAALDLMIGQSACAPLRLVPTTTVHGISMPDRSLFRVPSLRMPSFAV